MKSLFLIIVFSVLLFSCTKDERLLDLTQDKWKLLVSTDEPSPKIMIIEFPSGNVLNNDIFLERNGSSLSGPIERIAQFGSNIYLIIPTKNIIEVIDCKDFKRKATIDFSSSGKSPVAICFPNATSAYISHINDSTLSLVDITAFQVARTIKVGRNPVSLAVSGNQIYCVNRNDNTVSIVDSRTNLQDAVLNLPDVPVLVDVSTDGERMVVISAGTGKIDTLAQKSAAKYSIIDVKTRNIIKSGEIKVGSINPVLQIPRALASTVQTWSFILSSDNFFRLNNKTGDIINPFKGEFLSVSYNNKRDELIVLKRKAGQLELSNCDPITGTAKAAISLPANVKAIFPL